VLAAKIVNALLWAVLAIAIGLIVAMVWHPWVAPWTGIKH